MRIMCRKTRQDGFTLMEIVVATMLFAIVTSAITALFNYTLKINRRTQALRVATQGMRSFVEFIVKEVRNGQIDYSVSGGKVMTPLTPCPNNSVAGTGNDNTNNNNIYGQTDSIRKADNAVGIITADGDRECIYLADVYGNAATGFTTTDAGGNPNGGKLIIFKNNSIIAAINPPNFTVDNAMFFVRPLIDPYTNNPAGSLPRTQPFLTMMFKFTVTLATGEKVPLYYQTSVSTDKYDVPNN